MTDKYFAKNEIKFISKEEKENLLKILQDRFEKNRHRHEKIQWDSVYKRLEKHEEKLWSLLQMEETGGEPDVIGLDEKTGALLVCDCAPQSPTGRRSLCYDQAALESRKANKPVSSALQMAEKMGIQVLDEEQYQMLQSLENVDTKTSSWLLTPGDMRKLGGAIFGDCRYQRVFIYHNGAESYYAGRGFRGLLRV